MPRRGREKERQWSERVRRSRRKDGREAKGIGREYESSCMVVV